MEHPTGSPSSVAKEPPSLPVETWTEILRHATSVPDDTTHPQFVLNNRTLRYEWDPNAEARYKASMHVKRNAVMVCRLWYTCSVRFLYEHVSIKTQDQLAAILDAVSNSPISRDDHGRGPYQGSFIHRLDLLVPQFDWFPPVAEGAQTRESRPIQLYKKLPNLVAFIFATKENWYKCNAIPFSKALTPQLKFLHSVDDMFLPFPRWVEILGSLPKLTYLDANILYGGASAPDGSRYEDTVAHLTSPENRPSFSSLKELVCKDDFEFNVWYSKLPNDVFPNLQKAVLACELADPADIDRFLTAQGRMLTTVHLKMAHNTGWSTLVGWVNSLGQRCPRLAEFRLTNASEPISDDGGFDFADVLQMESVTTFGFQRCGILPSMSLLFHLRGIRLLSKIEVLSRKFPRLQKLQILDDETLTGLRSVSPLAANVFALFLKDLERRGIDVVDRHGCLVRSA